MLKTTNHPLRYALLATTLLAVGSVIVGYMVQNVDLIESADNSVYRAINGLPHSALTDRMLFPFGLWFLPWKFFFMPAFFYFLLFPFIFHMLRKNRKLLLRAIITLVIGLIIGGAILLLDKSLVYRERPFMHLPVQHLNELAKNILTNVTSYPSGHTRDTMIFAVIMSYFIPILRIPLFFFAFFIGFTRIYSGEHYPTDSLAGLTIGYITGNIAVFIDKNILSKKFLKVDNNAAK